MHDSITAERQGVPGLGVMTTRFVSAAELMSRVLGHPGYKFAVIEHPVSSANDAALMQAARVTLAEMRTLLVA